VHGLVLHQPRIEALGGVGPVRLDIITWAAKRQVALIYFAPKVQAPHGEVASISAIPEEALLFTAHSGEAVQVLAHHCAVATERSIVSREEDGLNEAKAQGIDTKLDPLLPCLEAGPVDIL